MRILLRVGIAMIAAQLPLSSALAGNIPLQPTFTKVFADPVIPPGGSTTLTFNLSNPNAGTTLTNLGFTDTLPDGMAASINRNIINFCSNGTITVSGQGGEIIALSGATLAPGASCSFSLSVSTFVLGILTNTTGNVTSSEAGTGPIATASVFVASPPQIAQGFGAIFIPVGGTTNLLFQVTNSNSSSALSGIGFTDSLPGALLVATPNGISGSCGGGTIGAVAGSSTISLSNATIAASDNCSFSVNVVGIRAGNWGNNVTASAPGAGAGNNSSSSLVVIGPPTISKVFGASSIPRGATTSLTFNLFNPNASSGLGGIGFTDNLPLGLLLATPSGLAGSCGGGQFVANDGAASVTLNANAILQPLTGCSFSVNVVSTTAGMKNNLTSVVTSDVGDSGPGASASIDVVAPPSIAKHFGAASIPLNGSTSLTFNITNPVANDVALTGVAFSDPLPTGLVVSSPNGLTGSCSGTITATPGANSIALTGGAIGVNSQCMFSVNVTATVAGNQMNTTNAVTSTNGGTGTTASASVQVLAADLTIAKTHSGTFTQGQTGRTYTITVTNNGAASTSGTVTVTDALPAGLNATSIAGTGWSCAFATLTCTRSDALAFGSSYPAIAVTVNVASNAPASVTNIATVSGIESNMSNDSASDPTTINPSVGLIAPTNLVATATSTTSISVTWNPVNTAVKYQLYRTDDNMPPTGMPFPPTTSTMVIDSGVIANTTYVYFVEAIDAANHISAPSNSDIATTVTFTPDPLVAGTTITAARVNLVRTAIDYVRATMGLGVASYTNPIVAGGLIRASDVLEMRSTLDAIRSSLNLPAIQYSNPGLTVGSTIRAADVQELTDGVK